MDIIFNMQRCRGLNEVENVVAVTARMQRYQ